MLDMNEHTAWSWFFWALLGAVFSAGCWDDHPCDPGQEFRDGLCFNNPSASGGSSSTGGQSGSGGSGGQVGDSTWGMKCEMPTDCAGDSPICAPAPLGYCTNINCSPGEENADTCPDGWTCFPASNGNPSACVNL
jgi:hypothetical protein